jgi:hypothetical protein
MSSNIAGPNRRAGYASGYGHLLSPQLQLEISNEYIIIKSIRTCFMQ